MAPFSYWAKSSPGRYPLKSKTTLLQAVTLAGGLRGGVRNKIVIFLLNEDSLVRIKASFDTLSCGWDQSEHRAEAWPPIVVV
jgi:hypothetical protein